MSIHNRIRQLESKVAARRLETKVHFFDSEEDYADSDARFGVNDIVFINDVPETDD